MDETVTWAPVRGVWVRHLAEHVDPLAVGIRGAGRFHRPGTPALYLADEAGTAWAEWYRALAEADAAPGDWLPRLLWSYEVDLERVADLTTPESLAALGLPEPLPDRGQWPAFHATADRLRAEGAQAVIYASAARPAGRCMCVLDDALAEITPVGRPRRVSKPPAVPRGMRT